MAFGLPVEDVAGEPEEPAQRPILLIDELGP